MSFYVTLPSNSSMDIFPNNTASNYSTLLKTPLSFKVAYEVALVEISYSHSWTVYLGELIFYTDKTSTYTIEIISNEDESFEMLVEKINKNLFEYFINRNINELKQKKTNLDIEQEIRNLSNSQDIPKLIYKNGLLSFSCNINSYFKFTGVIANLLYVKDQILNISHPYIPIRKNLLSVINAIYVYSDIIEYQFVGDSLAPLLRTVITSEKDNSYTVFTHYDNPHYIPVNKSEITSINIDLRDETGENIHFERGKILIKLHFRPIKNGF